MNQAQFAGERALCGDPQWSPLASPFVRIARELTMVPPLIDYNECQVMAALDFLGVPETFEEVRTACGRITKDNVYLALRRLTVSGWVVQLAPASGQPVRYARGRAG